MTTKPPPSPQTVPFGPSGKGASNPEDAKETALIPLPGLAQGKRGELGRELIGESVIARLPVEIDVSVPIKQFRVRNLLTLAPGQVIESQWVQGEDMPMSAPGVQLAWTEFEVMDGKLAVRITRLA